MLIKVTKGCKHTHNTGEVFSLCCRTHTMLGLPCNDAMSNGAVKVCVLLSVVEEVKGPNSITDSGFIRNRTQACTCAKFRTDEFEIVDKPGQQLFNVVVCGVYV